MMVTPVACAMQLAGSYKRMVIFSAGFAVVFTLIGLTLAYYARLKPGATIVLTGVLCLLLIIAAKRIWAAVGFRRRKERSS
jgi:zinc transport system permease protein